MPSSNVVAPAHFRTTLQPHRLFAVFSTIFCFEPDKSKAKKILLKIISDYSKASDVYFPPPPPNVIQFQAEILVPTLGCGIQNLRPPSVVVSDHDLCPGGEASFITLDEIDAEFNQSSRSRRRISDCSTCSSISFSEMDFSLSTLPQEDEEDGKRKVNLNVYPDSNYKL